MSFISQDATGTADDLVTAVHKCTPPHLDTRTLTNAGTITWSSQGGLDTWHGPVINNLAGAVFDVQSDASFRSEERRVGKECRLRRAGEYVKNGGSEARGGTAVGDAKVAV